MYAIEPTCVICGTDVGSLREYLCVTHAKEYPRPWPEWLVFLINDVKRERMDVLRSPEISFADCPEAEMLAYGEP